MNQQTGGGGRAAFSVIFGVIGIVVAIVIPTGGGIASFVFGVIALALAGTSRRRGGRGLAVFGIILGIISLIIGLLSILACAEVITCAGLACAALS